MIFYHLITMSDLESVKKLVMLCIDGVLEARKEFQELFGPLIYSYPKIFFRSNKEEKGDFYLYVFDKDRMFKRLKGFQGNNISLKNYLRFFVLRDLYLEWMRSKKFRTMDTVSYDEAIHCSAEQNEMNDDEQLQVERVRCLLRQSEFFILKLLYLQEYELSVQDIRLLADTSGRSIGDTLLLLNEICMTLAERNAEHEGTDEDLNKIFMISIYYQKEIEEFESQSERLDDRHHHGKIEQLQREKAERERKLVWRDLQRQKLLGKVTGRIVTTSYKDLSRLLNWPLGTICSKVARARKAFKRAYLLLSDSGPSQ
ncbi:MAG: hypothetical protein PHS86_00775 [Syntrophaceae bacterium]|nr:hypothetical protein [Syntrophaceae bacterium]